MNYIQLALAKIEKCETPALKHIPYSLECTTALDFGTVILWYGTAGLGAKNKKRRPGKEVCR